MSIYCISVNLDADIGTEFYFYEADNEVGALQDLFDNFDEPSFFRRLGDNLMTAEQWYEKYITSSFDYQPIWEAPDGTQRYIAGIREIKTLRDLL